MQKKLFFVLLASLFVFSFAMAFVSADSISISYPGSHTIYQRDSLGNAAMIIKGTYVGSPSAIEARFNGGSWQIIDNSPSLGRFSGTLNSGVAQGLVEVRFANNNSVSSSVEQVGVGDIYVITGASNADGHGFSPQTFNTSLAYNASVFDDINMSWKLANDPISIFTSVGSYYPLLASYVVEGANIPVGFITASYDGSQTASYSNRNTFLYRRMIDQISNATNGTMKVKAAILHTGGNDAAVSLSYTQVLTYITDFANNFAEDTVGSQGLIVAEKEARFSGVNRSQIDTVRRAMKDSWNYPHVLYGPTLYDIEIGPDTVHFASNESMRLQAQRFWAVLNAHFYNTSFDGRGPVISSISFVSGRHDALVINYAEQSLPLQPSSNIKGFRIEDPSLGVLTDINMQTFVIGTSQVLLNLDRNISSSSLLWYASFNDAYQTTSLRDSSQFSLPAETVFFHGIQESSPSCFADFNGDGTVGSADLAMLLGAWGTNSNAFDLNGDGVVNSADLALFLGSWGPCSAPQGISYSDLPKDARALISEHKLSN